MNKSIKYWDDEIVVRHIGTELGWLYEYLDENDITNISFIDIGGNVGKFYDELSKKYKIDKCVIVEASSKLCDYMREKFSNNNNIEIYNLAISDQEGYFDFNDSGVDYWFEKSADESINLGLSRVSNSSGQTECVLANTFLEKYNTIRPSDITFIKIDTENRDIPILGDMINYLYTNNIRPFILFENNYHNDMSYEDAQLILNTFTQKCGYEKVDLKITGDQKIVPKKNIMNKKLNEIIYLFKKFPKKYWDTTHLTGEDHDLRRSKPAPYIKSTIEIAKLLGMKTVVEIGSTRMAFSKKCLDYYKEELDPFISPSCCADGHGGVLFTLEGFEVYSVDIDVNCITQNKWSFENINMPYPSNLHLNIPKDGIEFLRDFQDKIDVLYLDGWDINTINYKEKHLEAYEVAKDKLSDLHLILIDDTDFTLVGEGKDALLSPHLIKNGYIKLFDGRQTLYINRMPNENEIIEIVEQVNSYDDIVKMIDNNPRVTLSLTTVPQRLEQNREGWGVKPVIDKLLNLSYNNYEIHFNIPYINRKLNKEYVIPQWLLEYEKTYEKLKIFRCHDYGPLTKLAPTLLRLENDNDIVITVDDDLMYIDGFIEEHLEKRKKYPNMAIGFAGIGSVDGSCHFCTTLERDTRVKILEGYKTVSYLKKFFKEDFFNHFANQSWSDDIIISAYLGKENIEKWVVNYSGDKDFRAVVESFPVLNHLPNDKSGCWEFRRNNEDDNSNQWYKLKYLER